MKVLFLGGTRRAFLALEALAASGAELCGVISLEQHAHETERFEEPIERLAAARGVPHHRTPFMKERDYSQIVRQWAPDVAFAVGCRILLPPEIYAAPRLGTLAVHDSLLPAYRGFAPLNWAILNGEDHTGVTLFYLDESMDGGDIVAQERIPIGPHETAPEVYENVCQATVRLIVDTLPRLAAGAAPRRAQDHSQATYTCSRAPEDGGIDWRASTAHIYNLVRALTRPYPGAFTFHEGRKLWIWRARPAEAPPRYVGRVPGRIVHVSRATGEVQVLTGDGVLALHEVQLEGRPPQPAAQVLTSVRGTLTSTH